MTRLLCLFTPLNESTITPSLPPASDYSPSFSRSTLWMDSCMCHGLGFKLKKRKRNSDSAALYWCTTLTGKVKSRLKSVEGRHQTAKKGEETWLWRKLVLLFWSSGFKTSFLCSRRVGLDVLHFAVIWESQWNFFQLRWCRSQFFHLTFFISDS